MCGGWGVFGASLTSRAALAGDWRDRGTGKGRNTSINFPLRDGMDDESFIGIFRPVRAAAPGESCA